MALEVIRRRRFHRVVFALAGLYNVSWGVWSIADPQWFFRFTGMPPANYPAVFACLGMVVGLYGILYFEVARAPEGGWLIAAVGLTGKVLGPAGMLWLIWSGAWPASALTLCLTNDFIWWVPFALDLPDAWPALRAHATFGTSQSRKSPRTASQPSLGCAELRLGRRAQRADTHSELWTGEGCLAGAAKRRRRTVAFRSS